MSIRCGEAPIHKGSCRKYGENSTIRRKNGGKTRRNFREFADPRKHILYIAISFKQTTKQNEPHCFQRQILL